MSGRIEGGNPWFCQQSQSPGCFKRIKVQRRRRRTDLYDGIAHFTKDISNSSPLMREEIPHCTVGRNNFWDPLEVGYLLRCAEQSRRTNMGQRGYVMVVRWVSDCSGREY